MNEGHTIGVEIALGADFTYDTDFGFAIRIRESGEPVPARKTSL